MEVLKSKNNRVKKGVAVLGIASSALVGCGSHSPASAEPGPAPVNPFEVSQPSLQDKLIPGWQEALNGFNGDIDIAVYDHITNQSAAFTINAGPATFDTASTIKLPVAVEATLQGQARGELNQCDALPVPTPMTCDQLENAIPMIRRSDNSATTTLWRKIGGQPAVQALFNQVAPDATAGSSWGLSQVTAHSLLAVENEVAYPGNLLTPESAAAINSLMATVQSDQRWGIGAGTPDGVVFENKNGWLDDASTNNRFSGTSSWTVNSVGHVHGVAPNGQPVDYTAAIVSRGNANYPTGQDTLNRVASVTNAILAE